MKEEYVSRYLEGNIGKVTLAEMAANRPIIKEDVPEDTGPLAPSVMARLPPLDATPEEAGQLNYMFLRDDYEAVSCFLFIYSNPVHFLFVFIKEYDMEAEEIVSSLQLNTAEDSDIEVALKLAHVDMYIRRLRERVKRKRLVRDYQLVAKFFANQRKETNKRPLTREQRYKITSSVTYNHSVKNLLSQRVSGPHEYFLSVLNVRRARKTYS